MGQAHKSYYVSVGGWSNSRKVVEKGDKVMLEIALGRNHCPTCSDRVRYVTGQLAQRNVQYSWAYPEGPTSYLVVDHPGKAVPVREFLSKLLNMSIR